MILNWLSFHLPIKPSSKPVSKKDEEDVLKLWQETMDATREDFKKNNKVYKLRKKKDKV